jgi:hypothetical protein
MNPLRFASLLLSACALGPAATAADLRGPFEIVTVSHRESAPGHGMNPFRTRLAYTFRLKHLGKPLAFHSPPDTDGGQPGAPDKVLARAYFVDGGNAVLVATGSSSFIVTQAQGQAVITHLAAPGFSAYQWLDSASGHPGPKVYSPAKVTDEARLLAGGKLLLLFGISNKLGVLDVGALKFHPLASTGALEQNGMDHYTDGYRDDGGPNGKAREVSPGGTQFVQLATKYVNDQPAHAFVVIDFARNTHALVPLDVNATRLNSLRKLTPQWFARYYEWTTGTDGTERFSARRAVPAARWAGYLTDRAAESPQYRLQPVSSQMQAAFMAHLESKHGAVRLPPKPGQTDISLRIGADAFALRYYADGQMLTFEPALDSYTESAIAACQAIGNGFEQVLAGGAHQALFTQLAARDIWAEH